MNKICVGIDMGKAQYVVAVKEDTRYRVRSFSNQAEKFTEILQWLKEFKETDTLYHFCLESTGTYGLPLATFLHEQGHVVSVVNPAKIKYFAKSQLIKTKTDAVDAQLITQYCQLAQPAAWTPFSESIEVLRALSNRLDMLISMRAQEKNHLESAPPAMRESITRMIDMLKQEIKKIEAQIKKHIQSEKGLKVQYELLQSIPAIGNRTIIKVLAFFSNLDQFQSAKQLAAYVGLNPRIMQSGTCLHASCLSKMGSSKLRKMLYMPAVVAKKHNPAIKIFYDRLVAQGKPKKLVICAVMRKLIHLVYGVLKSGEAFSVEKALGAIN